MEQSRVDVAFTQENVNPPLENVMVCPTTIGRAREIESLSRLIGQLSDGHGTTVVISGEAGIGKSRLVSEARSRAASHGVRILQGAAFELDRAAPYGPIADLFRAFFRGKSPRQTVDDLGPCVGTVGRLLPSVAAWMPSDQSALELEKADQQLLQGLIATCDRLIDQGPSLVVVEDIHWADESSLDLLLH